MYVVYSNLNTYLLDGDWKILTDKVRKMVEIMNELTITSKVLHNKF